MSGFEEWGEARDDLTRDPLRVKQAKERFGAKSFAVIQDVLPSVDTAPIQQAWDFPIQPGGSRGVRSRLRAAFCSANPSRCSCLTDSPAEKTRLALH